MITTLHYIDVAFEIIVIICCVELEFNLLRKDHFLVCFERNVCSDYFRRVQRCRMCTVRINPTDYDRQQTEATVISFQKT